MSAPRLLPPLVVLSCVLLVGCGSTTHRFYERNPVGKGVAYDSVGSSVVRVVLVRPKDCRELELQRDEGLLAVDPALGTHAILLFVGKGLVPASKWGTFPSTEVSTKDQTMRGWLLEMTEEGPLKVLDEIVSDKDRKSKGRSKVDDKTLRAVYSRWWQIVTAGKAVEYGVRASPVTGSVKVEGMERRYRKIILDLEAGTGETRKIQLEVENRTVEIPVIPL